MRRIVFALLGLMLLAREPHAATAVSVTYDNSRSFGFANTINTTLTVGAGTNRFLVIAILQNVASPGPSSGVSFHNTLMTNFANQSSADAAGCGYRNGTQDAWRFSIWTLVSPETTTNPGVDNTITSTLGSSVGVYAAVSFANVDQTTPLEVTFGCTHVVGSSDAAAANAQFNMTSVGYNGWNGGGAQLFLLALRNFSCGGCVPIQTVLSPYDTRLWSSVSTLPTMAGVLRLGAPSLRGAMFPLMTVADSVQTNDIISVRITIRATGVTYGS